MTYVTAAIHTSGAEVANLVRSMSEGPATDAPTEPVSQFYYLRSTAKGSCVISGTSLSFTGPSDAKRLDEDLVQLIQNSDVLQNLIKQGRLEIISEHQFKQVCRDHQAYLSKRHKLEHLRDKKELDSILIQNDKPGSALEVAIGGRPDPDDIVVTEDMTEDINKGRRSLEDLNPDDLTPEELASLYGGDFA